MKISDSQRYDNVISSIEKAKEKNFEAVNRVSSQKSMNSIHDDPNKYYQVLKHNTKLSDIKDLKNNIEFAKGFIDATESAMTGIKDSLGRAQELAVSMANDTKNSSDRKVAAKELSVLFERIVQLANSQYQSKYIFSGFKSSSPSMDGLGNFLGDDGEIFLKVDDNRLSKINVQGRSLFGISDFDKKRGYSEIMDTLRSLQTGLKENSVKEIQNSISNIDFHLVKLIDTIAEVGVNYSSLEKASEDLQIKEESETKGLSEKSEVDIVTAATELKKTEGALQASMMAGKKLLTPSLLNFLQ